MQAVPFPTRPWNAAGVEFNDLTAWKFDCGASSIPLVKHCHDDPRQTRHTCAR
ncbi:MAG: hypothetical protein ACI9VR_003516 [Cognaticolwellia sp.]|jgi:hypothetical protein